MEYELSDLATTLIPPAVALANHAVALANWAIEHNPDIDAHREAYDKERGDSRLRPAARCLLARRSSGTNWGYCRPQTPAFCPIDPHLRKGLRSARDGAPQGGGAAAPFGFAQGDRRRRSQWPA